MGGISPLKVLLSLLAHNGFFYWCYELMWYWMRRKVTNKWFKCTKHTNGSTSDSWYQSSESGSDLQSPVRPCDRPLWMASQHLSTQPSSHIFILKRSLIEASLTLSDSLNSVSHLGKTRMSLTNTLSMYGFQCEFTNAEKNLHALMIVTGVHLLT